MTKEQMQAALNQATAEAAELKAKIADLETQNGRITAELAAAKKQIEATASANAILEDELKEARAQQQQPAGDPDDKGKIGILLGAIGKSCADHCPHHLDEAACKNCNVFKAVFCAGYQITRPEPAQEV